MRLVAGLAVTLLASGCLQWEETEIRILREQGEPAVFVVEYVDFYSDEFDPADSRDPERVRKDFDELIRGWRSKEVWSEAAQNGFLIKGRDLFTRDGKIVLRHTGIILNLTSDHGMELGGEFRLGDSQITWTTDDDQGIVETNGKILSANSRTIVWPRDAPELRLKLRRPLSEEFAKTQPQMMQLLTEYLAAQAGKK